MRDVASAAPTGERAESQTVSRRPGAEGILALQRTAGNRAVGRLLQRYARDRQGRILDREHHAYDPSGTQRTRLPLWVDGFLDFHDFTPLPRGSGRILDQRAELEHESHTVRDIAHTAAAEAAIDARTGRLSAPVDVADVEAEVRQAYYDATNPGMMAASLQVGPMDTLHIPLGGGSPSFDMPGIQAAVAIGIPTMRANERGWVVTLVPSQLSLFGDSGTPLAPRLQSWLGGVQLGYAIPVNRTLVLQLFAQAMGGLSWPHATDLVGMPQTQEGFGFSMMWTLPAGFSWGGQIAATHTHTFFLPGHMLAGDATDTIDFGLAFVLAWGSPMGAFRGLTPPREP